MPPMGRFNVPVRRFTPRFARASPSAATASSSVPYASTRRSSLGIRSPPNRRPVVPSSPRVVATAEPIGLRALIESVGSTSPHQPGIARVPPLGQDGDLHGMVDDLLGGLL